MNTSKKRYYIYENVSEIKNHNYLIDFLKMNKCKYTENKNGIFVNLNTIDEDKINHLYSMVYESINNLVIDDYINQYKQITEKKTNEKFDQISINNENINLNDILLDEFSDNEKLIINYSKTYF